MLILAHGFFVAGEFGIIAVDRSRIEQLANEDHKQAESTLAALKELSFHLSGAQLGITITSLVVGFIAEPTIGRLLEPLVEATGLPENSSVVIAVALALGLATAAEMIFGELVPKNIAIAKPMETALRVSTPLRLVNGLQRPLIVFLNSAANATVRLFGIEPRDELLRIHSLEELDLLVRSSRAEGMLEEHDFSLLARSISFENKTAADALLPRTSLIGIKQDASLSEVGRLALESGHSRFPVYEKDLDDIVGTVHIKDTYRYEPRERETARVEAVMQQPLFIPESRDLASLLVEIRRTRKHLAIVVDEYGGTAGIITLEDILEEIVGDIEDEYDPEAAPGDVTSPPDGVHILPGMFHPDEVLEGTGFDMPEGDYETLAGFVVTLLERIPEVGDHTSYRDWEFKVVEMEGRRIAKVLVVAPPDRDGP
ncbi:MAG: hemolysin family protein [Actinomycetota bacterium]|nr:hemolysin family protein [Actinomycetota bacterium]